MYENYFRDNQKELFAGMRKRCRGRVELVVVGMRATIEALKFGIQAGLRDNVLDGECLAVINALATYEDCLAN